MNSNEEIVENLSQKLRKGDVVLVKASNGMKFFEICQKLQIFLQKIDIMQIPKKEEWLSHFSYREDVKKMKFKDYYKILNLENSKVTIDQIKTAYRKQAKKYHPDVNVGNKLAEERIKVVIKYS